MHCTTGMQVYQCSLRQMAFAHTVTSCRRIRYGVCSLMRAVCACAGLRLLADSEVDEVVASIEAEKAAAEAARRGPSSMSS